MYYLFQVQRAVHVVRAPRDHSSLFVTPSLFWQSEGASIGTLSGKRVSERWMDPVMFWLHVMTAQTFTAWAAGLGNWKGSECSNEDKVMFFGGKEGKRIWYLLQISWGFQLPLRWRQQMEERRDGGYLVLLRCLWTRSSADLTWGMAFTWVELFWAEDLSHTACLSLDIRKRKHFFQLFSAKQLDQTKISPFLLLPGNSLLLKSLLHSCFHRRSLDWSPAVKRYLWFTANGAFSGSKRRRCSLCPKPARQGRAAQPRHHSLLRRSKS